MEIRRVPCERFERWIGQQYRACEGWSMKRRDQISVSQPLEELASWVLLNRPSLSRDSEAAYHTIG